METNNWCKVIVGGVVGGIAAVYVQMLDIFFFISLLDSLNAPARCQWAFLSATDACLFSATNIIVTKIQSIDPKCKCNRISLVSVITFIMSVVLWTVTGYLFGLLLKYQTTSGTIDEAFSLTIFPWLRRLVRLAAPYFAQLLAYIGLCGKTRSPSIETPLILRSS